MDYLSVNFLMRYREVLPSASICTDYDSQIAASCGNAIPVSAKLISMELFEDQGLLSML